MEAKKKALPSDRVGFAKHVARRPNYRPSCDMQMLRSPLGKSQGGRFGSFLRPSRPARGRRKELSWQERETPFLALSKDPGEQGKASWAFDSRPGQQRAKAQANRLTQVVSVAGGLQPQPMRSHGRERPPRQTSVQSCQKNHSHLSRVQPIHIFRLLPKRGTIRPKDRQVPFGRGM